jgi:hypothetical protein
MVRSRGSGSDDHYVPALSETLTLRLAFAGLLAILLSLLWAGAAGAQTTRIVGETSLQGVADGFLVPAPAGRVRVEVAPCPSDASAQGCHSFGGNMDTIWLNPATGGLDDETFTHEMGHVFESYMWNLRFDRHARFVPRLFRRIVPLLGLEPGPGVFTSTVWTERFAEAYSLCARESSIPGPVATGYFGFEATPEQHAATCGLIDALGSGYERTLARDRAQR